MSQYQRLFLIADQEMRRTPAFERAVWLAQKSGAALHIGLYDYHPAIAAAALLLDEARAESIRDAWIGHRRDWLTEQTEGLRRLGLKVTSQAVWARAPREEIVAHIHEHSPHVVIKDVAHEAALKRMLLKPLDWHLLRDCKAPVMLVNSLAGMKPRRVFAAVDTSSGTFSSGDFNDQIVGAARTLSKQCDAELHVATCFDFIQATGMSFVSGMPDPSAQLYDTMYGLHREGLKQLSQAHGIPFERTHLLRGSPARTLAEFAQDSLADVLVLGTHQRRGLTRLMMGSTAESILDSTCCDVLVVKPDPVP